MLDAVAVNTAVAFATACILILQLKSIIFSFTHRFIYELHLITEGDKSAQPLDTCIQSCQYNCIFHHVI
jgi:hypothetical protein